MDSVGGDVTYYNTVIDEGESIYMKISYIRIKQLEQMNMEDVLQVVQESTCIKSFDQLLEKLKQKKKAN